MSDRPGWAGRLGGRATSTSQPPDRPEPEGAQPARSNGTEPTPLPGPGPRGRRPVPSPEGAALRVVLVSRDKMLAGALRSLIEAPGGVRMLDWYSEELDSVIRHADVVIVDMPPTLHARTFAVLDGRFLGRTVVLLQEGEDAGSLPPGPPRAVLYRPLQIGELWAAVTGTTVPRVEEAVGPGPEADAAPEPEADVEPVVMPEPEPDGEPELRPEPDPGPEPEVAAGDLAGSGLPTAESGRLIGLSGQELDPVVGPGQVAPGMDEATFEWLRGWKTGPGARPPAGGRKGQGPGRRRSEAGREAAKRAKAAEADARREQARADARTAAREESLQAQAAQAEASRIAREERQARAEEARQAKAARAGARMAAREEARQAKAARTQARAATRAESGQARAAKAEERRSARAQSHQAAAAEAEARRVARDEARRQKATEAEANRAAQEQERQAKAAEAKVRRAVHAEARQAKADARRAARAEASQAKAAEAEARRAARAESRQAKAAEAAAQRAEAAEVKARQAEQAEARRVAREQARQAKTAQAEARRAAHEEAVRERAARRAAARQARSAKAEERRAARAEAKQKRDVEAKVRREQALQAQAAKTEGRKVARAEAAQQRSARAEAGKVARAESQQAKKARAEERLAASTAAAQAKAAQAEASKAERAEVQRKRAAEAEVRRQEAERAKVAKTAAREAARAQAAQANAARAEARAAARAEAAQAKAVRAEERKVARERAGQQRAAQAEARKVARQGASQAKAAKAEERRAARAAARQAKAATAGAGAQVGGRAAGVVRPAVVALLVGVLGVAAAGWVGGGGADTHAGEVATVRAAGGSEGQLVTQDPRVGPIEPLQALGVGAWLRATEAGSSLEAAVRQARVPSRFLLGGVVGLTVVLFLLLMRVGPGSGAAAGPGPAPPQRGWRLGAAALAGVLVALDPLLVQSGRAATGTILAVLLAVGTVALAWGVPVRPALRWLPLVAACGGLALLVSPLALAMVAVPVVAELLQGRYQDAWKDMAALGLAIAMWLLLPLWVAGQDLGAGQAGWLLGRPPGRGSVAASLGDAPLTWLLVAAGLTAAILTWRHRSGARSDAGPGAARLLAWTATTAAGVLGAVALGYPAEQALPFAVPAAAVSVAAGAWLLATTVGGVRGTAGVVPRWIGVGAGVVLAGLLVAQVADWTGRYSGPADDGLGRLVASVRSQVPACSAVNASGPDDQARLLAAGVTVTDFADGLAAHAAGVRYFVVTGATSQGGPMTPSLAAWVRQHGTRLAAHPSRSLSGVELWRVDAAPLDPVADLVPVPNGVFSNTTGSACGGYRVVDSQAGSFHTAYRSVGGKAVLGRPLGSVWTSDGPALQAFDTMVLGAVPTASGPPEVRPIELPPLLAKLDIEAVADADMPLPSVAPPVTNRQTRALLREQLIGRAYLGADPATATDEDFRRARDRFGRPLGLPQMMPDGAIRQPFERAVLELPADGGPVRPAALGRLAVRLGLVPRQAMRPEPVPGLPARPAETRLDPASLLRLVGGALALLLLVAGAGAVLAWRSRRTVDVPDPPP